MNSRGGCRRYGARIARRRSRWSSLAADERNDHDAADIMCGEYKLVIATCMQSHARPKRLIHCEPSGSIPIRTGLLGLLRPNRDKLFFCGYRVSDTVRLRTVPLIFTSYRSSSHKCVRLPILGRALCTQRGNNSDDGLYEICRSPQLRNRRARPCTAKCRARTQPVRWRSARGREASPCRQRCSPPPTR